jgi:FtsP/CotA-like multicopper oxidase with cupredoxin domain
LSPDRRRLLVALAATTAVLAPLGWLLSQSLVPGTYSVMDMGYVDAGGGTVLAGHQSHSGRQVTVDSLVADPARKADVALTLTARQERFRLASGEQVDGYTLNGSSPGPLVRARQGELVEVRLVNESVADGVTLHWHGVDVPNAMDGVAGVTQDAVARGESFTYRFVAEDAGTYWYHSHQVSHEQVQGGLLGALVVDPPAPPQDVQDELALLHGYDGTATVNGHAREQQVDARPGEKVRVRVINTDNGAVSVWASGQYRVLAVDGNDVHEPQPVTGKVVRLTAGGRADLEVVAPARVDLGGAAALLVGEGATAAPQPRDPLDLLSYGRPEPLGFDPGQADRRFEYRIGRRPGFLDGRPGLWWSINGRLFPDVPMYTVAEGDVVRMRLENSSGVSHPMHLHGHHAVVLSRNGKAATGSPWVVDSLDVGDGDSYEIAFVADNPGLWMDHCHNLPHAADGLVAHLTYDGVHTPYRVGGPADNEPE